MKLLMTAAVLSAGLFGARAQEIERMVTFNDDGGWCWFQDERALVQDGKIIIGSIASGYAEPARRGNVEVTSYDLASSKKTVTVLHPNLQLDDHAAPAFLVRPDGRLLTLYSKHGDENHFYYRISAAPGDATRWRKEHRFTPSESSRITYSNLHLLSAENGGKGRIYDFYRGLDDSFKPSYAYSDDWGASWASGNVFIRVPTEFRHRPYVKYASDGISTVHIFYTDGHPRNFDNSVYHVFYRDGELHASDGRVIRSLREGLERPGEGTLVFRGDPDNVAWVIDVQIDSDGHPYGVFSVQKDAAGLPPEQDGKDHRFHYARWDGDRWIEHEIAYGGRRLYAREGDYTGLVALDPDDRNILYISTDADPVTGVPLISKTDKRRHREIFKGVTADGGATWKWSAITKNSSADNLRPIVPKWSNDKTALLWLRGEYRKYTDYDLEVVGLIF